MVVARPSVDWFPYEREALAAYVAEGGRALLLLDAERGPRSGRRARAYGVLVGDDVVLDMNRKNQMLGVDDPSFLVLSAENFGQHAITRNLAAAMCCRWPAASGRCPSRRRASRSRICCAPAPTRWGETDPDGLRAVPTSRASRSSARCR